MVIYFHFRKSIVEQNDIGRDNNGRDEPGGPEHQYSRGSPHQPLPGPALTHDHHAAHPLRAGHDPGRPRVHPRYPLCRQVITKDD